LCLEQVAVPMIGAGDILSRVINACTQELKSLKVIFET
jgi:hypothetical protein